MGFIRFFMIVTGLALIGIGVASVVLAPKWEPVLRKDIESKLGGLLGTEVHIGSLRPAWLEAAVALENVTIKNPPNFKAGDVMQCARVLIQPEALTMFSKSPSIACVTLEGMSLRLKQTLADGSNLDYLKQRADNAVQLATTKADGLVVKEVRAENTQVEVVQGDAVAGMDLKPLALGAIGIRSPEAQRAALSMAGFIETLVKQSAEMQGVVQPLVDLVSKGTLPVPPPVEIPGITDTPEPTAAPKP